MSERGDGATGRILSVNTGRVRAIEWQGRTLETGIFKHPVAGPVAVLETRLDGDEQANLAVHGGPEKSIYAYPIEHYAFWRAQGIADELPHGSFGENLTIEGFREDDVRIGDRFRAGSAELVVRQPRMPCTKLCARFSREDMIRRFTESQRTGFYLSVAVQGAVAAGEPFTLIERDPAGVTVLDVVRLYTAQDPDPEELRRALGARAMTNGWRERFEKRLQEART